MKIHIAPVVLHIRCYDDAIDTDKPLHKMQDEYLYNMICTINDLGIARLEGLSTHDLHADIRHLVADGLLQHGVKRVEWRHHGVEHHIDL